jgi:serine/threonine-protein kinase
MANVYLALSEGASGFRKLVVIKSLREHLATSPEFCSMLLDEARLAARLNHPNVVQTYEVGTYAGRPALVMEYLEGQPLSAIVSRSRGSGPLPLSMHLKIIAETLIGLEYAHDLTDYDGSQLYLVHRDVSPSNIIVTFDGNVKVLDFGIAKAATSSHNTNTGELKGKIAYMSPEQMLGERVIDRRADLFAVGVMIWEAAAGQRMWEGCNEVTIMRRVLNDDIPKLRDACPDVPEGLVRICDRALAVDRDNRYGSAGEIERDLDGVMAQLAETVKMKDIGRYVGSMFAEVRSKTRKVIEEQTRVAESDDASLEPVALGELLDGSATSGKVASPTVVSSRTPRFGRRPLWAALVALVLTAGGALFVTRRGHSAAQPIPAAATAASALPMLSDEPAREAPQLVDVALHGRPEAARFFWDGEPLATNPVTRTLPRDGTQHAVRIEAPGYVSREVRVTLDHSATFEMDLERATPSSPAPPTRTGTGRVAPHLASPVSVPQGGSSSPPQPSLAQPPPKLPTSCDPPFFLDDQGIRHPKPACL